MKQGYGVFSRVYDELMEFDYPGLVDFYESVFSHFSNKPLTLLDLACGTGKVTALLSQRGYDMVGVDASTEMLSMASANTCMEENVLLLCQTMQELDLNDTVDGVVCSLDGINHLPTQDEVRKAFKHVALFLNQGGLFIFDIHSLLKMQKILGNNTFLYDTTKSYCVWQNHWNKSALRVDYNLQIFIRQSGGLYRRYDEEFSEYYYEPDVLKSLLEQNGFEVLLITAGQELKPFEGQNCDRHYVIARKI